jgi:ubiquinone/menaquinone biosynthesis C-methylase UbiE
MNSSEYIPAVYWDEVAARIRQRGKKNYFAGDDEPFYRYKRNRVLEMLRTIPFNDKRVLEVGPGPGGNLIEVSKQGPAALYGADISGEMISLAKENLAGNNITIVPIDGTTLPFADQSIDIVFTVTVLQHVTDENALKELVREMCRVSAADIYLFERIEQKRKSAVSNIGRTVAEYADCFTVHDFMLQDKRFARVDVSHAVCGAARRLLNHKQRQEAEPVSPLSIRVQKILLPLTKKLERLVNRKRDLALLHFKRTSAV